jgi:tRNA(Ile)-lysidine synthase
MSNALPPSLLTNSVEKFLSNVQPGERVLIACSGGADSLVLAWVVQFVAKKKEIFVSALIVDHQLSPESNEVAQAAKSKLEALAILDTKIIKVEVLNNSEGIEAAAREIRYEALTKYGNEINAQMIFLGHTLEDQVETVLMRLTRGSGARSLQGMAEVKGKFVRPFLHIQRAIVRDSLSIIDLTAWEDPMNYSEKFLRSKVRNQLLPKLKEVLGESVFEAIDRTATQLRVDNAALDLITQDVIALNSIETSSSVEILLAQPQAIRTRVIRAMMLSAGAPAASLANTHIEAVNQLVTNWHGQGEVALPGKLWASRSNNQIAIESKNNREG